MDEWPAEKKERVYRLIQELPLPEKGIALDFGCGNGVFTDVIKKALPNWEVYGSDLSAVAVSNASKRFLDCIFLEGDAPELHTIKFDFIFSHHVLEHVEDKSGTAELVHHFAADAATMLHILPCGNKGSLEYNICALKVNGIRSTKGNTFFFEEEMHLQRFTTTTLAALFEPFGFKVEGDWYANHFFGSLQWITRSPKNFILQLTDSADSRGILQTIRLKFYRFILVFFYYLQRPSFVYADNRKGSRLQLSIHRRLFASISNVIVTFLDFMAGLEWGSRSKKTNGSEMYLFFKR